MSQSVKLKDGSYIDASGVWDNTQGKSQEDVNASLQVALKTKDVRITGSNYTFANVGGNKYTIMIPITDLIGEYTFVYSILLVSWSGMACYFDTTIDGSNLTVWATSDSVGNMTFKVRFVYV